MTKRKWKWKKSGKRKQKLFFWRKKYFMKTFQAVPCQEKSYSNKRGKRKWKYRLVTKRKWKWKESWETKVGSHRGRWEKLPRPHLLSPTENFPTKEIKRLETCRKRGKGESFFVSFTIDNLYMHWLSPFLRKFSRGNNNRNSRSNWFPQSKEKYFWKGQIHIWQGSWSESDSNVLTWKLEWQPVTRALVRNCVAVVKKILVM